MTQKLESEKIRVTVNLNSPEQKLLQDVEVECRTRVRNIYTVIDRLLGDPCEQV